MALPTQDALLSLLPASGNIDPAMLIRRLSAMVPGAQVSLSEAAVTLTAGQESVTVQLPPGTTLTAPVTSVRGIANANAPVTQTGKAPTDAKA